MNSPHDCVKTTEQSAGSIDESERDRGTPKSPKKEGGGDPIVSGQTAESQLPPPIDDIKIEVDVKKEDVLIQTLKRDAQLRDIDPGVVSAYIQDMEFGLVFPPIVVFRDDSKNMWAADGFHQISAAESMRPFDSFEIKKRRTLPAEIHTGTLDDAKWYAYGANKTNGFCRSNKTKRRAVKAALEHPRSARMSNVAIAKHVGVSEGLVRIVRDERQWDENLSSKLTKMRDVNRNGTTYKQDVSRIGKTEDEAAPLLDCGVALPNVERSLNKLYEMMAKANEAVWEIEQSIAGGSTFPMLPSDRIEVIEAVRDGLDALIRWKTHPPSDFERAELKRVVMLREQGSRKPPTAQKAPKERVA